MLKYYNLNNIKLTGGAASLVKDSRDIIQLPNGMYLKLLRYLRSGGSAEVYEIKLYNNKMNELKLDSDICVKITSIDNDEDIQKHLNEFKIAQLMGAQNIGPKIYDNFLINQENTKSKIISNIVELNKHTRFKPPKVNKYISLIIMQKLNGASVYEIHEARRALNPSSEKEICKKIDKMHNLGYIHNDLHSENIFIDTIENEPYIIDYGYSNYIDPTDINSFKPVKWIKNPTFHFKTLGNLIEYLQNKPLMSDDKNDGLTVRNQYCKRADWSCERGIQSLPAFYMCNKDISREQANKKIVDNNQSSYSVPILSVENLMRLPPPQEILEDNQESSITEMRMSDDKDYREESKASHVSSIPEMRMSDDKDYREESKASHVSSIPEMRMSDDKDYREDIERVPSGRRTP